METPRKALVWKVDDPEGQGRVQLIFPSSGDVSFKPWAPVLQAYYVPTPADAPANAPAIGDEVLVVFLGGHRTQPVVVGRLPTARNNGPRSVDAHDGDAPPEEDGDAAGRSRVTRLPRGRPRLRAVDDPED